MKQGLFYSCRKPLLASSTDIQFKGSIDPVNTFVVPQQSFSANAIIALPETNGRVLVHKFLQLADYIFIFSWSWFVTNSALWQAYGFTCLTLAYSVHHYHVFNQATFLTRASELFCYGIFQGFVHQGSDWHTYA